MTNRLPIRMFAPALAFGSLATSQAALAQDQACVAPTDLSDAVVYAMPIAFDAARSACAKQLDPEGFVAAQGDSYIAQFRENQDQVWPGAFRMLQTFMSNDEPEGDETQMDMGALIDAMPPETLRPFVDALVGQMIAAEIKSDSCGQIERGLELISPMPAQNIGGLVSFIVELTDMKNPPVCGTEAKSVATPE
ncbi:hypothetical protein [Erythrobacter sp. R86502]|uniref:hypothetical protein n=1 Tax=Erythrobacter sp. R86502 TaxID=3093846 RepID=UPI0036D39E9B